MEIPRLKPLLFTLGFNPNLAEQTSKLTGLPLINVPVGHFADGETIVKAPYDVSGRDCFVLHSTCPPVNERLMELLVFTDALRRNGARSIISLMPYFGYARQDRILNPGDPITGLLVSQLLQTSGVTKIVMVDFHSSRLLSAFPFPHVNLSAEELFAKRFQETVLEKGLRNSDLSIVSTDRGAIERTAVFARHFPGASTAHAEKIRPAANVALVQNIQGNVDGKTCLIYDDIIDTAGTLRAAIEALYRKGAKDVWVAATHGLFSDDAVKNLSGLQISELLISDSIERTSPVGETVSLAPLLSDYILND